MTPRKADATVPGLRTLPASVGRHAAPSAPVRRNRLKLGHVSAWQLDMRKRIKGNVLRGGDDDRAA